MCGDMTTLEMFNPLQHPCLQRILLLLVYTVIRTIMQYARTQINLHMTSCDSVLFEKPVPLSTVQ